MALVIANWKMNLDVAASTLLLDRYVHEFNNKTANTIVVCPSLLACYPVYQAMQKLPANQIKLGVQNFYYEDEGAFTGEVSAYQLRDLIDYAIVGHSERRQHFGESDKVIALKIAAASRHGIISVLCVGENLTEHQAGQTNQIILDQLADDLAQIDESDLTRLVIAYEPIWSIGTGHHDNPIEVEQVFTKIREFLQKQFSPSAASLVQLLYGGSVEAHDAKSYLDLADCGGLLVGHASLNDKEFAAIAKA